MIDTTKSYNISFYSSREDYKSHLSHLITAYNTAAFEFYKTQCDESLDLANFADSVLKSYLKALADTGINVVVTENSTYNHVFPLVVSAYREYENGSRYDIYSITARQIKRYEDQIVK